MKKIKKLVILWGLSVLFLVASVRLFADGNIPSGLLGLIIAIVLGFVGFRGSGTKKTRFPKTKVANIPIKQNTYNSFKSDYEIAEIKVAGATFKNGRKTRQAILRAIKWGDGDFAKINQIRYEEYEFNGDPAFGVFVNGQQIGNIPADMVGWYLDNRDRIVSTEIKIKGGGESETGEKLNFGALLIIKLKTKEIKQ